MVMTLAIPRLLCAQLPELKLVGKEPSYVFENFAETDRAREEKTLRKQFDRYREAYQNGDSSTIAKLWAPDGEALDPEQRLVRGRDEIQKQFGEMLGRAAKNAKGFKPKVESKIVSIRFVQPNLAVVHGVTKMKLLNREEKEVDMAGSFSGLWRKHGEDWLIESAIPFNIAAVKN